MDNQVKKTILLSFIVSLITTVPFAILVSFLTMQSLAPNDTPSFVSTSISQALDQSAGSTQSQAMNEEKQTKENQQLVSGQQEVLQPNRQTSQTEEGRQAIARTIFTTDKAVYALQASFIQKDGLPYRKQSIMRADNETGDESVWIDDLKTLDTTGSIKQSEEFSIFSNPKQGTDLYLEVIPSGGTELVGMDVYRFSLKEPSLTKLAISSQLRNNFGAYTISPTGTEVLLVPPVSQDGLDQDLFLIDLANDSSKRLFSLKENETFNAGGPGLLVFTEIKWVDNENFVYHVYDQSLKPSNPDLTPEGLETIFIDQRSHSLSVK